MKLSIVGILCIAALQSYALTTVRANPLGSPFGSSPSFLSSGQQSAGFADGIRHWLRNVKNRIFGGNNAENLPPPEAADVMMKLENETPEERRRNHPKGFFLDLSTLNFDPSRDWGFRLGKWYFIHSSGSEIIPAAGKPSDYPEWPTVDENNDNEVDPPVSTVITDVSTTMAPTTTLGEETPGVTEPTTSASQEVAESTPSGSPEVAESTISASTGITESTASVSPKDADNGTTDNSETMQSTEILLTME